MKDDETIVEVCRASGINFATMCTANIDTAIKVLYKDEKIAISGEYKDRTYFKMNNDERKLVDNMAEEIYVSTRFLLLSSNTTCLLSHDHKKNQINI